jgi:hypothetical protein
MEKLAAPVLPGEMGRLAFCCHLPGSPGSFFLHPVVNAKMMATRSSCFFMGHRSFMNILYFLFKKRDSLSDANAHGIQ